LVGFFPGTPGSEKAAAHRSANATVLRSLDAIGVQIVSVPPGTVAQKITQYEHNPNVNFAEPDYRRYIYLPTTNEGSEPGLGIPDNFVEQWALENTGQLFGATVDPLLGTITTGVYQGISGADISAPEGWDLIGSPAMAGQGTKIAIIDSGVDCTHPDLLSGGISKCLEEVNFVASSGATLADEIGHGTHVATIAAAYTDNGVGTAGVASGAALGSLKVCYADLFYLSLGLILGVCDDSAIAEAILHAACLDVPARAGCQPYHVINMSLAGPQGTQALEAAVNAAWTEGVLIVAGAANDYTQTPQYPAAYPNVIAVAATDYFDNLAYFSTFGNEWVSLAAPGHTIFSAVPNAFCGNPAEGCYDWLSGTSMSTPLVAGAAAVVWAHQGATATNFSVRQALENGAETTGVLEQNLQAWVQHGRLNLEKAILNESPDNGGGPAGTFHIGDLDGASANAGGTWLATISVRAHDESDGPVTGAHIAGVLTGSGGYTGTFSCTTSSGICSFTSGNIPKKNATLTAIVNSADHATMSYLASDNHDPDGDSDGTEITLPKP
jgi:thermitase